MQKEIPKLTDLMRDLETVKQMETGLPILVMEINWVIQMGLLKD